MAKWKKKLKVPKGQYIAKVAVAVGSIKKAAEAADGVYAKQHGRNTTDYRKDVKKLHDWQIKEVKRATTVIAGGYSFKVHETPPEMDAEKEITRLSREMKSKTKNMYKQLEKKGVKTGQKNIILNNIRRKEEPYNKEIDKLVKIRNSMEKLRKD